MVESVKVTEHMQPARVSYTTGIGIGQPLEHTEETAATSRALPALHSAFMEVVFIDRTHQAKNVMQVAIPPEQMLAMMEEMCCEIRRQIKDRERGSEIGKAAK